VRVRLVAGGRREEGCGAGVNCRMTWLSVSRFYIARESKTAIKQEKCYVALCGEHP